MFDQWFLDGAFEIFLTLDPQADQRVFGGSDGDQADGGGVGGGVEHGGILSEEKP